MIKHAIAAAALFSLTLTAAAFADRDELIAMGKKPEPPAMARREIRPPATQPAGTMTEIVEGEGKPFALFVPAGYALPADGHVNLTVHFHGAAWFAIDEHLRRGLTEPLLVAYLGEGSGVYTRAFADPERLSRLIGLVERQLGANAKVTQLDVTSFSAGYGAVREIVKQDKYVDLIRRIILCDSLYAGWDPATTKPGATSLPAEANMKAWEHFLDLASTGQKTFVFTHSQVPTSYANTAATAAYIAASLDVPHTDIAPGSTPAASDPEYPLLYRADLGHLHLWGYGGTDAMAHMTQVRHLADVWKALDACGDR